MPFEDTELDKFGGSLANLDIDPERCSTDDHPGDKKDGLDDSPHDLLIHKEKCLCHYLNPATKFHRLIAALGNLSIAMDQGVRVVTVDLRPDISN